ITVNGKRKLNNALKKQKMLMNTLNGLFTEFLTEFLDVKLPSKFKSLSLFQDVFPLENLKPKTNKDKKKILLTLKVRLGEILESIQEILKEINQKLNEIK
ncbi:MAG: hypothetical protein QXR82_07225, partial [Candidatus Bathyarchaeia archaeon]